MIRLIVAMTPQGVIAVNGKIPWKKPEDLKRFKEKTMGGTLIMGRVTWDSLGRKSLPGRTSIVLSKTPQSDVVTAGSIVDAIRSANTCKDVWIIGGAQVYSLAFPYVQELDITHVMDYKVPDNSDCTFFNPDLSNFCSGHTEINPKDNSLIHHQYHKRYIEI